VQIAKTLAEVVSKYAQVVLDGCAYAGTGNVLKVQELLALCGEHIETEEATAWKVGRAVGLVCRASGVWSVTGGA
jgi:26S proteasome regulatory subunit N1